jgi:hypothetical protein
MICTQIANLRCKCSSQIGKAPRSTLILGNSYVRVTVTRGRRKQISDA